MTNEFVGSREACLSILENAVEGILVAEIDSRRFKYANTAVCEMFGYSPEEFIALSVCDIHPSEHVERVMEIFEALARGDITTAEAVPCRKKNGAVFRADIASSKVTIDGVACNVGFFSDVTEKMEAEERAETAQKILSLAADSIEGVFWIADTDLRITLSQGHGVGTFGFEPDQAVGMSLYDYFHTTDPGHPSIAAHLRALRGEVVTADTVRNGLSFSIVLSPISNEDNDIIGVVGLAIDTSGRRKMEQELARVAKEWQQTFDATSDAIWLLDKDHLICRSNSSAQRIFNRPADKMIGRHCWEIVHGSTSPISGCPVLRSRDSLCRESMELQIGDRWFAVVADPVLDENGVYAGSVHTVSDITARKQEENERAEREDLLRGSEANLKKAQEIAHLGSWVYDLSGRLEWSDEMYRIYGVSPESFAHDTESFINLIHPDDRPLMREWIRACMAGEMPGELEFRAVLPDGAVRHISGRGEMIRDADGKPVRLAGTAHDITERKEAEAGIIMEKERLSVTLRSIADGVITTDIQGNVVIINKVAEELTGWAFREAQGRPIDDIFTVINEYTRERCENPAAKVLASGKITELANHTLLVSRDGTERAIADSGAPITNSEGETIGVVLVFRDMTEKQKMIESLQRAAKLESIGVLAGGVAHDFNNLLSGIFGYIDLARTESKDEQVSSYLSAAMSTMDRVRGLTHQLLTFSRGGAPVRTVASLIPFIRKTADFALSGSSVSAQFDMVGDLWPCGIDKNQIGQVIDNIIINAQQAMPNGGVVEVTARNISLGEEQHATLSAGRYVKISFRDSGIGIPAEIASRIFDPFYTTKTKGHGLGLATSYAIINRHGGAIDVESWPGNGSIFHIFLPASEEPITADAQTASGHRGTGKIIVMDDVEVVRTMLGKMLSSMGYSVISKSDGEAVLEYLEQESRAHHRITAVFLDLTIRGGMGGLEAGREIRKRYPDLPLFVTSGYAENPVMANPAAYGFTASIPKPFTLDELAQLLAENFGKRP